QHPPIKPFHQLCCCLVVNEAGEHNVPPRCSTWRSPDLGDCVRAKPMPQAYPKGTVLPYTALCCVTCLLP
ncbi:hypothetical protein, partial [Brasilonema octagenarum]|uniref:hypothetical protein n=1 Tax=Brasilonema octagenarum TaxID=417105 RepID=UPI001B7CEA96